MVHIHEKSALKHEIGADIHLPSNASRILLAWGPDPEQHKFVKSRLVTCHDALSLETSKALATEHTAITLGGSELYHAHRFDLHNGLRLAVTRQDGPGTAAILHLNRDIMAYVLFNR